MLRKLVVGLAAVVGIVATVIARQPSSFVMERSAAIEAPADLIYGHIENLRAWEAWSPFAKMDPEMKTAYEGPVAGVGAAMSWEGPEIGKDRMIISAVRPDQEVDIRLEFLAPMEATNRALFTLAPKGEATQVTWRMEGTNRFVGKAISLVVDMD
jgi:hypothetical protein